MGYGGWLANEVSVCVLFDLCMEETFPEWICSIAVLEPDITSHSRTIESLEPEASRSPFGENMTELTSEEWPRSVELVPDTRSHSRTVASSEPEASNSPSGENAMDLMFE